jgi:phenylacetic acid degradation operon negative regulatory protein
MTLSLPTESRSAIEAIVRQLGTEPSRTWSIVVTIFGDAVVPRGGALWLGSLLGIFAGMGIGGGVVRTAMSRLAADGWLERSRVGRNSFYRLTDTGRASFAAAARHIYGAPPAEWDGGFTLVLPGPVDRDAVRAALEGGGFGSLAPGVWIAPRGTPVPAEAAGMPRLDGQADLATGRELVGRAWDLVHTADAYWRFQHAFAPLGKALAEGAALSDLDALVARTLLIHQYRRVVLRDPLLPAALLAPDWPGTEARRLAAYIYRALLPGSERWLDAHGQNAAGALPPPGIDLAGRFASGGRVTEIL